MTATHAQKSLVSECDRTWSYPGRSVLSAITFFIFFALTMSFPKTGSATITAIATSGTGDGQFVYVRGIDIDDTGLLYLMDMAAPGAGNTIERVQVFSSVGGFVRKWGSHNCANGGLYCDGSGIAYGNNSIYVVEDNAGKIKKSSLLGVYQSEWSTSAGGTNLGGPQDVHVSATNRVIAVDPGSDSVAWWDSNGSLIDFINLGGSTYSSPREVVTDTSGNMYVVGLTDEKVHVLDENGVEMDTFDVSPQPSSIDVMADETLVVGTSTPAIRRFTKSGTFLGMATLPTNATSTEVSGLVSTPNNELYAAVGPEVYMVTANPEAVIFSSNPTPYEGQLVTLDASASSVDLSSISGYEWDLNGDGTYETDTDATSTTQVTYSVAGTYSPSVRVTEAGGRTGTASTTIIVAANTVSATVSASVNPALTDEAITFDGSTSSVLYGSISNYQWDLDGDGNFETDTGTTPKASTSFSSTTTRTISLRVTSSTGSVGTATVSVNINQRPPYDIAGISINGGAIYTNDPNVSLTVSWPNHASQIRISNDGGFLGSELAPIANPTAWTLPTSGDERLPKTVYARFSGGTAGAETYQDDIILDQTIPTISKPKPCALRAKGKGKQLKWIAKCKVSATDSNSGIEGMQIATVMSDNAAWKPYSQKSNLVLGKKIKKTIFYRVRDKAGNVTPWKKISTKKR